jgi:hypothetical protein
MAVVFSYPFSITYWVESLISACILILVNLFIRSSGKNQPEGVKDSNLLVLSGNINIIIILAMVFIPQIQLSNLTQNEYPFYKIYSLITELIVPISSFITFGIFFTIFGIKNQEKLKKAPLTAGVSMTISNLLKIISSIFYMTFLIDYYLYYPKFSIEGNDQWSFYLILINFPITTYLFGVVLLYGHSKFNKDRYMQKAMLLMLFHFVLMTNLYWFLRSIYGY